MSSPSSRRLMAALIFLAVSPSARPDSLTLDSGKVIEGTIIEANDTTLKIDVGGTVVTIPRAKVKTTRKTAGATTETVSVEQLDALELKADWPGLYEAATEILRALPENAAAAKKQKLAESKIREALAGKEIAEMIRQRKFTEAIALLTEQFRKSNLASRGAGAVGRRALAELYVASAEARMRTSLDGHIPLAEARKARELDPAAPGLDYTEGMAQMKLHHFPEAIALLERAARADPENFGIRLPLMQCYRQTRDHLKIVLTYEAAPVEAAASAQRWPEVRTMLAEAYCQVALRLADQGSTTQAATAYGKHLGFTERTPDQLRDAEQFFERIGDREQAAKIRAERLWGRTPDSPDTTRSSKTTGTLVRP